MNLEKANYYKPDINEFKDGFYYEENRESSNPLGNTEAIEAQEEYWFIKKYYY